MDDPIFGPWSDQENAAPTPPFRAARWRPRTDPREVPGTPVPPVQAGRERPARPAVIRLGPPTTPDERPLPPAIEIRPRPVAVAVAVRPDPVVVAHDAPAPDVEPPPTTAPDEDEDVVRRVSAPADPALVKLRTLLVPACQALSQRLIVHRHLTTLDDRLDWSPPSVRFRVEPWRAPFDSPEDHPSSAIEFELEDGKRLAARVWMDVFSTVPDHRDSVSIESLTSTWIEKTLMGYVTRVLAGV